MPTYDVDGVQVDFPYEAPFRGLGFRVWGLGIRV